MEVWAARVALIAHPDRQRLLSQENSLQTTLRFSARSQLERLVAGLAAQLAALAPQQPTHPEAVLDFLLCRWTSQALVPGVAAQRPFHHEIASRFLLLCRWVSQQRSAGNHNSMRRQPPAERASPTPQGRRAGRSGSSSQRARYYLDTRRSLMPSRCQGNQVSIHLK